MFEKCNVFHIFYEIVQSYCASFLILQHEKKQLKFAYNGVLV
jgi:hypothetical protein